MKFRQAFHLILVFSFLVCPILGRKTRDEKEKEKYGVVCQLEWSAGFFGGRYPDESIDYGSDEIIVRVRSGSDYCGGRLVSQDEAAYAPCGAGAFTTYEVIINPKRCEVDWLLVNLDDPEKSTIPPTAVTTGTSGFYIARGETDGYFTAGHATSSTGLSTWVDGSIIRNRTFEVMVSKYPPLHVELNDFSFKGNDFEFLERAAQSRVFAIEVIENHGDTYQTHIVNHSDIFQEYFEIIETTNVAQGIPSWGGISNVDLSLQMWFGSPTINEEFDLEKAKTLITRRDREISLNKQINIGIFTDIVICSYAVVSSMYEIKFAAIGTFSSAQLTPEEMKYVLQATGRTGIIVDEETVRANVEGIIRGRYIIRVACRTSPLGSRTPCIELMDQNVGMMREKEGKAEL